MMLKKIISLTLALLLTFELLPPALAQVGACQNTGQVCTQGAETRIIDGVNVYRDCWAYQENYQCVDAVGATPISTCDPLVNGGCGQIGSRNGQVAWNGTVLSTIATYQCTNKRFDNIAGITYLGTDFKITKEYDDESACASDITNAQCSQFSQTCNGGPETRTINGLAVTRDCWASTRTYLCSSNQVNDDCGQYKNDAKCSFVRSIPQSEPTIKLNEYRCRINDGNTITQNQCTTCVGGVCTTDSIPDQDFGKVMALMETAREAMLYANPTEVLIFGGKPSTCTRYMGNTKSCCGTGGMSKEDVKNGVNITNNQAGMGGGFNVATEGLKAVGSGLVKTLGSTFVHDAIFSSDLPDMIYNTLYNFGDTGVGLFGDGFGTGGQFFSYYGVTVSIVTDGTGQLAGFIKFDFSPWGFIIAVIVQILMFYNEHACDEELKNMIPVHKALGTYHEIGNKCTTKWLGQCVQSMDVMCVYNSTLARLIQEQGRAQIGKSWGTVDSPDCKGFTMDEINLINFDQIDFSEFIADVQPRALDTAAGVAGSQINAAKQSKSSMQQYQQYLQDRQVTSP